MDFNSRLSLAVISAVLIFLALYFLLFPIFFSPTASTIPEGESFASVQSPEGIQVVAESLSIPWEIAFLASGEILATERTGNLIILSGNEKTAIPIDGVRHVGEGGLHGIALHPDFTENKWIYLYFTSEIGGNLHNRVERFMLEENALSERTAIIEGIPAASNHDGGRIAFGPDKMLYIGTGDAADSSLSQGISSLAGKILRLKDNGEIPEDNPFGNAVFSFGHRNVQGLAWDSSGNLWATEHGPSGFDELNFIEKGKNYGWPEIKGDESMPGMELPVIHSGQNETWAPAGIAFLNGSLFFGGLRGESVYEAEISGSRVTSLKRHFSREFGRIRAVSVSPDGLLFISTSNTDGRGTVREGDDKIIRLNPEIFR